MKVAQNICGEPITLFSMLREHAKMMSLSELCLLHSNLHVEVLSNRIVSLDIGPVPGN